MVTKLQVFEERHGRERLRQRHDSDVSSKRSFFDYKDDYATKMYDNWQM